MVDYRRSGGAAEWHGRARDKSTPPRLSVRAAIRAKKTYGHVARRVSSDCVAQPERAVRALVCDVLFGLGSENVAHIAADGSSPVVISSSATVDDIWRDV